jgi:tRNA A-37 threonylcarbamoyl transferase component Bud32
MTESRTTESGGSLVQARLPARYRVIEEVGQGGMAVVYKARDESLKREVAVKLLHPHLLAEPESKIRLEREAQAVAKLHHDNIVQIFDYSGSEAPSSYIVTEFIDGQTLKQFMAGRRPPPPEVAALIAIEIGGALLHAHSFGIIHRDVKPDNVMVGKDGVLKLMDFGVAQIMDLERMTVTGQLLGSPAYMAPELLEGRPLDVRTDVFSVGILLYQLATGALPFSGRNPHEVLKRIAEGKFADPRTLNRLIADRMAKIIARALARRPDDRYAKMSALVDDLLDFVNDAGLESPRAEVRGFFTGPDAYEKAVVPRMIAALVESGKRARESKHTAQALELWNRALAMDPSNREVLAELKQAAGRQHLQRGLVVVAVAGVLASSGFFMLRQAGEGDRAAAAKRAPAPADKLAGLAPAMAAVPVGAAAKKSAATMESKTTTPGDGAPAPGGLRSPSHNPVVATASGTTAGTGRTTPTATRSSGRTRPPPEMRTFELAPIPAAALITVDGVSRGFFGPGNETVQLDMTRDHELIFQNDDCCEPKRVKLGPNEPLPIGDRIPVKFEGRPAILTVKTDPPSKGSVGVWEINPDDGQKHPVKTSGELGSSIAISFKDDGNMSKQLVLTVSAEGRIAVNHQVEIHAGEKTEKTVKLDN